MRILLQFPEGLKQKGLELAKKYEEEGHQVFLSASPCYGACDLAIEEAKLIKADKIVHFGHNKFVKTNVPIPIDYVPYYIDIEIRSLKKVLPYIKKFKNIGLVTTVQHVHQFEDMKAFFEKNGKTVFAAKSERATEIGQVLGCDAGALMKVKNNVDAIIFVGSGMFHPLALDVEKPVFGFNPNDKTVKELNAEIEKVKKRRKGAIAKALTCKKFGILVSTKIGQFNITQAEWAKKELEKRGFESFILIANEFDPMAINNYMEFECFVNTACPRIADDQEKFGKPVLNIEMLRQLFEIIDANR
ncbi:diphthamide biosynthesis enzyme Dph2 [Candidatus Micrarchaeota archaeon]|nr:diphthamide biosynthesis enzyme Dph2 [Candidatus Micrarchaeota archaeon]